MVVFGPLPAIIRVMKCAAKTTILAVTSLLLGAGAEAVTPDAPAQYQGIVERNVFNIHPPATVNTVEPKQKEAPPKVTLNGITTILGKKVTFLTIPGPKPGAPAETLMLAEEQGQDDIEVKQIDEKAGVVKIVNHGDEETLDFDHNGTRPAGPEPSKAVPFNFPPPIPAPPPQNIIRPLRTLPQRSLGGSSTSGGPAEGGGSGGIAAQNQTPMSWEDQETVIEAQRMKAIQEGDDVAKILPPTEHTAEVLQSMGQAPQ